MNRIIKKFQIAFATVVTAWAAAITVAQLISGNFIVAIGFSGITTTAVMLTALSIDEYKNSNDDE